MSKALASCKVSYLRVQDGSTTPLIKALIGEADYQKDMAIQAPGLSHLLAEILKGWQTLSRIVRIHR
jgi:hypothetical protein